MAAGSPGGVSARTVVSSSPADVPSSPLQFPAPTDSRSRSRPRSTTRSCAGVISAHKERQALALTSFLAERLALSVHGVVGQRAVRRWRQQDRLGAHPFSSANGPSQGIRCHRLDGPACRASPPGAVPDDGSISTHSGTAGRRSSRTARSSPPGEPRRRFPAAEADLAGAAVLVDDLVTTGSSLTEAARVLRAARIPVLGAATVAADRRRASSTACSRTENSVRIPRNR